MMKESESDVKEHPRSSMDGESMQARGSDLYINKPKTVSESMDFEEMESVMWRKVLAISISFFLVIVLFFRLK
jgi:hypothetical protein